MRDSVEAFIAGWKSVAKSLPDAAMVAECARAQWTPLEACVDGIEKANRWVLERNLQKLGYTPVEGATPKQGKGGKMVLASKVAPTKTADTPKKASAKPKQSDASQANPSKAQSPSKKGDPPPAPDWYRGKRRGDEVVGTFKTAKGSSYKVHSDGTTTRDKAFRPEHGEKEQGLQPRTGKTVYVTMDQAAALATPSSGWRMFAHDDGTVSMITRNKSGEYGAAASSRNIRVRNKPAIGLVPLELWHPDESVKGPKGTAYKMVHFGNKITQIGDSGREGKT